MNIASALFNSASGLRDANFRMGVIAHNVANSNTDGFVPDRVDSIAQSGGGVRPVLIPGVRVEADASVLSSVPSQTEAATEFVNLVAARNAYAANAKVIQSLVETDRTLMDMLG